MTSTTNRIPVEDLSFGVLDMQPIDTDWNPEEYIDDQWRFWEAVDHDVEDVDGNAHEFVLVTESGSIVAVFAPDGHRIDDGEVEEYLEDIECPACHATGAKVADVEDPTGEMDEVCPDCEGTGNTLRIEPDDIHALFQARTYDEGPMMNYRYPTGDSADRIGGYGNSCDAVEAAYRLRDVPLCVVEYEGEIALALTGGGMDLTWEIVDAFTLLGYLPPIHYCDLPGMAGYPRGERHRYLIDAVERSLRESVDLAQRRLERHTDRWKRDKENA